MQITLNLDHLPNPEEHGPRFLESIQTCNSLVLLTTHDDGTGVLIWDQKPHEIAKIIVQIYNAYPVIKQLVEDPYKLAIVELVSNKETLRDLLEKAEELDALKKVLSGE